MLKHKGTVRLATDRLILRKITIADAPAMFRNWATSKKVTKFLTWFPHENVSVTESVLRDWETKYSQPDFYQWAIELKSLAEPVGTITVVRINEKTDECEIGYCIGDAWWGQGITAEAFRAVIDFLFKEVGAQRIMAKHDVDNPNSGKVMLKCGLQYEGTMRRAGRSSTGKLCDLKIYSVLSDL